MRVEPTRRWAVPLAAVFVVLFAPAHDPGQASAAGDARKDLEARVLAPTFDEALRTIGPKITLRDRDAGQGSALSPRPLATVPATISVFLLWASFTGRPPGRAAPLLIDSSQQIPRGPPAAAIS